MNNLRLFSLFEKQASQHKDKTIIAREKEHLSYDSVLRYTNYLAGELTRIYRDKENKKILLALDDIRFSLPAVLAASKLQLEVYVIPATVKHATVLSFLADNILPVILADDGLREQLSYVPTVFITPERDWYERDHPAFPTWPAGEGAPSLTFLIEQEDGCAKGVLLSATDWWETFQRLDERLVPGKNDCLLFFGGPLSASVYIESLWALCRGLAIVMETGSELKDLLEYIPDEESFPMDFGLFYFGSDSGSGVGDDKYKMLMDTVKYGDEHGFSSVWTPERHFNEFGGLFPNPSVLSAALAVSTRQVQIRCGSLVAPLHDPLRIAEDWSLIDNLSHGRASVSFASGWQSNDFVLNPDSYVKRHDQMFSHIEQVRQLWNGASILRKDGLGNEIPVKVYPRPVQQQLPVWITVSGKTETFEDAGRIGANILTHLLWQDTDELIGKIKAYRKARQENGFDPDAGIVSLMVHTFVGEEDEEVRKLVRAPLKAYIKSSVHLVEAMVKGNDPAAHKETIGRYGSMGDAVPDDILDELLEIAFNRFFGYASLLGDRQRCKKMIKRLKAYGVNELACLIDFGVDAVSVLSALAPLTALKNEYTPSRTNKYEHIHLRCNAGLFLELYRDSRFKKAGGLLRKIIIDGPLPENILLEKGIEAKVLVLEYGFRPGYYSCTVGVSHSGGRIREALYQSLLQEGKALFSEEF